ncbi:PREDICTED: filament-like plant protein 7 isoform X2 [Lupinus angustifolius]|uniref:filament-like plant protein 7 isoform X2 n=1 Tax=Lupinus angustifolius TaxID=3871 RepID=UPI00092FB74C|nr:PREDICTED: filament-like plant protein 7 isoform X2 [Lupinus angustifolius]
MQVHPHLSHLSIMDNKTWLWRKKSSEKTIIATDNGNVASKENEEALLADKEELEKDLKRLNDKLALALSDCNAKDELVKKQTKIAQEAVAGWEKADGEVLSMKKDHDEALQQRLVYEERVSHLDGALKECMQQLRFVRDEQGQRIHDAVMKVSNEFEKERRVFGEQLSDTNKRLAKAEIENSHLNKSIFAKEKLIEDLKKKLTQVEANHNALVIRLESTESDNASLKYEVRVLEKELEIRNEEREFNRRTADASHKQHLEKVKQIAKLESECQRLRLLMRKRLPGPAALAKMKSEVEMLRQDSFEMRRKKLNSNGLMVESSVDNSPETTIRRINNLTEQLFSVEEENKTLKESLNRKMSELQFSRVMLSRTASKILQLESQIEESSKGQVTVDQPGCNLTSHEFSVASMSDIGSDDKVSCAGSWASALISELEHFKSGKQKDSLSCKSVGASDINLMDDFVEMEKLAVVSAEKTPEISHASLAAVSEINGFSEPGTTETTSDVVGKEIIPVSDHISDFSRSNQETYSIDILNGNIPSWLQDVVEMVLEQNSVTHKNPDDILEDIRVALRHLNNPDPCDFDSNKGSGHIDKSDPPHFNSSVLDTNGVVNNADTSSLKENKQQSQIYLSKSIGKIIELVEGISMPAVDYNDSDPLRRRDGNIVSYENPEVPTGYMVRVFQWKTSELRNILQQFLHVCYDLLNGKADHEKFAIELTTALDWIMNHCFSLQDVSSMRDAIKKQFDWDETRSESEAEIGMISHFAEAGELNLPKEQLPCLHQVTTSNDLELRTGEMDDDEKEEFKNSKDMLIIAQSQTEALEWKLRESEKIVASLRLELQALKESNRVLEDQIQNHKMINSDLDAQPTEAESKEAQHKVLALEVELEKKNRCCEELEVRCLEFQLQLESMSKEWSDHGANPKDKPLRTDWEITAASEKLAECQETILNLGKQLKALTAPKDASLFDPVIAGQSNTDNNMAIITTTTATTNVDTSILPQKVVKVKNRSLLDQMLAEDDTKAKVSKAIDYNSTTTTIPTIIQPLEKILALNGVKGHNDDNDTVNSLAILPAQKTRSESLWKKILRRQKKSSKKNTPSL